MTELIEPMQDDVIEEEHDDIKQPSKTTFTEKFMKLPKPIRLCVLYPLMYIFIGIRDFLSLVMVVQIKIKERLEKKMKT